MPTLNRDALLTRRFKKQKVEIESLNGVVYVRQLSGMERVEYERAISAERDQLSSSESAIRSMARLLAMCLVDENGENILTIEDMDMLATSFPFEEMEKVFYVCLQQNGLNQDAFTESVKN